MFINNILIIAKMRLNLTNLRIEMYTAKRPMLKAPVALAPLMVSCSKSWTTVGAGRCTQCNPSNVQWEVDDPRKKKTSAVIRKKRAVAKTLPKNLIVRTPEQKSQMQTTIPEACSPNSPCTQRIGTGKLRRQRSSEKWKTLIDYLKIFRTRNFQ
jgi:hypothetical protein